jgi:uncharacterized protein
MTGESPRVTVRDNPAQSRYELFVDDQLVGLATYVLDGETMTIPHTEVQPRFEGQGLGARLARFALDDVRERGLRLAPSCSFIAAFVKRHPDYQDLVVG